MYLFRFIIAVFSAVFLLSSSAVAQNPPQPIGQNAPLVSNPERDQFEFCKQLYARANNIKDLQTRTEAYLRLAPRLEAYIRRFPASPNTPAASYYLGECYYQSGYLVEARRVFHNLINRFQKGRYVALASNRLGYDAFSNKKYNQAAVYFGNVAKLATTPNERFRGRYQEASCYRYSGQVDMAIRAYSEIDLAPTAPAVYRENARLKLGYLYAQKKNLEKSLQYFASLVKPEVSKKIQNDAALNAGLLSLQLKKNDDAEKYLRQVLISNDEKLKSRAQVALMQVLYARKDYQGVFDVMKRKNYPGKPSTEAIKFTMAGKSAYQLKRYHDAIGFFAQAERQLPLSPEAFDAGYYRLLCFFSIEGVNIPKQVDAFLEVYRTRFPKNPKIHKALLMKAETLFDENKFREAAAAYNQINPSLVGSKNEANMLFKRGWCLSESGDHNGAIRSFTIFLKKYPNDKRAPKVIARRGKSYLALGNKAGAMRDFDLLIKDHPKTKLAALAWQNSARIKKDQQDYPEMIRRYEALVYSFPKLDKKVIANAYYWIGWGSYQLKEYEKAEPALKKSVELLPEVYGIRAEILLIYCSFATKNKTQLQEAVESVLKKGQGDKIQAPIYRWLGVQCFNGGEMKEAEKYLSLGVTPKEPRQTPKAFWKMLGSARVELGKYKEALVAIGHFLDVVEEPFWKAETLSDQARAYLGLGELDKAKKSAEDGLKLRPKGPVKAELRLTLGDVAYAKKDYNAAAASYIVVVEFLKNDEKLRPKALYKTYQALSRKGDKKQAKHYLDLLNKEFPDYLKK